MTPPPVGRLLSLGVSTWVPQTISLIPSEGHAAQPSIAHYSAQYVPALVRVYQLTCVLGMCGEVDTDPALKSA